MFVDLRVDLPVRSAAFLASLVLGIILVLSPATGAGAPEEAWLFLGALAALGTGARGGAGRAGR
ncbi:hypothetical protein ABZ926_06885 [Streptomyces litmocidini]|uniref:Uncharacterized protein n=1 Tax=Streptomyces litmocidini TaxID=67318 RepID=A0ABW7U451_9ACTN|nr:hypothetical protein [Streptomyces sp. PanSC19]ROQ32203.1 hypothetical protein EDD98_1180 [Streptomyces sp. PanSC19]